MMAADKWGPTGALVLSLTRAAASEAAGRDTGLSREMIGTLHSHCFRAIGKPRVVETAKGVRDWNEERPDLAVSGAAGSEDPSVEWGDVAPQGATEGDRLMSRMNLLRHRMKPRELWPEAVRDFADAWDDYKRQVEGIDFCDMIERALAEVPFAPGAPSAILCDESQDFSALELALLHKWAHQVDALRLVYDPAQALYAWRGADASMASAEPDKILEQSHRVPRRVQDLALEIIRGSSTYREAAYRPRRDESGNIVEGEVSRVAWTLREPSEFASQLDDPFCGTTMVLASCSYMLDRLVAEMRRQGIAYHNPFSPARWNPLRFGSGDKRTAVDRLLAMHALQTSDVLDREQLELVASSLTRKDNLWPEWKAAIERVPEHGAEPRQLVRALREVFTPQSVERMYDRDYDWWLDALKSAHAKSAEYPVAVLRRGGENLLREVASSDRPVHGAVVVGTVHSVKGGECDRVLLFPDLSRAGRQSLGRPGWMHRDGVYRMLYVGATRARQELVIGAPGSNYMSCPV